jgi:hypothetical protein
VKLAPTTAPSAQPGDIGGTIRIENVAALADLREAAAVDQIAIDIAAFNTGKVHVSNVAIEGIRGNAARAPSGNLRVAGVELLPVPPAAEEPAAPVPLPAVWAVDRLALRKLRATFRDEAVNPPADLALVADEIVVKDVISDPARPDSRVQLSGNLGAPGIARTIQLTGTATPFAPQKQLQLKLLV